MLDLALTGFVFALLALGLRRPFVWVLAYLYIDILTPQRISWGLLASLPISLIAFLLAFGGWLMLDAKNDTRFTLRQGLIALLLVYCGMTTLAADYPDSAVEKWAWVWKALFFAIFLPLTLRTRLRIEAATLLIVLTVGAIVICGGIKTLAGGGGYGTLRLFVADNAGIYEGSTLSTIAIAVVPLIWWLARFGTIFTPNRLVTLFALGLTFACLLIPIGTQTRTGLLCIALLGVLALRSAKRRFLYAGLASVAVLVAIPFLPESYTKRMNTIENHQSDQSASTRVAVWMWTLDYVKDHPFGGGFDAYLGNRLRVPTSKAEGSHNNVSIKTEYHEEVGRAYHSAYFEMLGEQGYPGFLLWAWIHALGIWQMERLRRRWKGRTDAQRAWIAPLANALQLSQMVYFVGALFIGIAFQPVMFMLIGLQCGLWSYARRIDQPLHRAPRGQGGQPVLRVKTA
ncbi:putative O-glycosylation ligase, exosortase A system-associated [Novosphingobium sp. B 225]|uniref:putative O-glycosylation ligase, exosortase A system-associated n=1 Tax=Novosphingobium sp. B 225 TaxID=1961849 RepID=UPI000B4AC642|nr:putative O-glycosylation ligase, exosortase A system-associated [Novosphingobium sp. B 225]